MKRSRDNTFRWGSSHSTAALCTPNFAWDFRHLLLCLDLIDGAATELSTLKIRPPFFCPPKIFSATHPRNIWWRICLNLHQRRLSATHMCLDIYTDLLSTSVKHQLVKQTRQFQCAFVPCETQKWFVTLHNWTGPRPTTTTTPRLTSSSWWRGVFITRQRLPRLLSLAVKSLKW